jgi:hypothetical protein
MSKGYNRFTRRTRLPGSGHRSPLQTRTLRPNRSFDQQGQKQDVGLGGGYAKTGADLFWCLKTPTTLSTTSGMISLLRLLWRDGVYLLCNVATLSTQRNYPDCHK